MSLIPYIFDDLLAGGEEDYWFPRPLVVCPPGVCRSSLYRPPVVKSICSPSVVADKDAFKVNLDVQQFKPSEITVKNVDRCVTVEGKHEERKDDHGFVSRHFVRRYLLPKDYDEEKVECKLSTDGILSLVAPKKTSTDPALKEKVIPIKISVAPAVKSAVTTAEPTA